MKITSDREKFINPFPLQGIRRKRHKIGWWIWEASGSIMAIFRKTTSKIFKWKDRSTGFLTSFQMRILKTNRCYGAKCIRHHQIQWGHEQLLDLWCCNSSWIHHCRNELFLNKPPEAHYRETVALYVNLIFLFLWSYKKILCRWKQDVSVGFEHFLMLLKMQYQF